MTSPRIKLRPGARRDAVLRCFAEHPAWTSPEIAAALGCHESYVRTTLSRNGLTLMNTALTERRRAAILDAHARRPELRPADIARSLGYSRPYVGRVLRLAGVRLRGAGKRLQSWERQAIIDAAGEGEKQEALAAEFGVTHSCVSKIWMRAGVGKRWEGGRWASPASP